MLRLRSVLTTAFCLAASVSCYGQERVLESTVVEVVKPAIQAPVKEPIPEFTLLESEVAEDSEKTSVNAFAFPFPATIPSPAEISADDRTSGLPENIQLIDFEQAFDSSDAPLYKLSWKYKLEQYSNDCVLAYLLRRYAPPWPRD